jgi:predicted DNA-binding transcriptional regulator YafY
MSSMLQKYMGCTVVIIYVDRGGTFSKRLVQLRSLTSEHVSAYCFERKAPRLFKISRILAVLPREETRSRFI